MSARRRARTRSAIILTVAITAAATTLLTGCGPQSAGTVAGAAVPSGSAAPSQAPSDGSSQLPSQSPSAAPTGGAGTGSGSNDGTAAGGTNLTSAANGLTISTGTSRVLMNGTSVDFGVVVRDLAWAPGHGRAAFIDGNGNLETANADGSGRVVVARAASGDNWSHPTWQKNAANAAYGFAARNNIFFASSQGGVTRLKIVSASSANGTPALLSSDAEMGDGIPAIPKTGNTWPNAGSTFGTAVFANSDTHDVYVRDDSSRESASMLAPGSQPALNAAANEVVFVRSVGGHDHLFVERLDSPNRTAQDITPNATVDYTEPSWSPDGRTVAARVPNGVVTMPVDRSSTPKLVSSVPGLPAYRG